MKKLVFILVAVMISSVAGFSQNKRSKDNSSSKSVEQQAAEKVESLKKEFSLTDVQCNEIKPMYVDFFEASMNVDKSAEGKKEMTKIREELNSKIEKVLTDEQKVKFKEKQKKMEKRGANRKNNKGKK